ncbi:MAG: GAF domain-containing protein [Blastocatellia bacterium]|nr:GAF domain-containing protein [Blastocatellia bacterium]
MCRSWRIVLLLLCVLFTVHRQSFVFGQGQRATAPLPTPLSAPASNAFPAGCPTFRIFNSKTGLPQNSVQSIAYDLKGYLWIGTQDGAAYYNGRKWTVVNMPNRTASNFVLAMLCGRDGSMWFGTNSAGLACLKNNQWTVYSTADGALPNNQVYCLRETIEANGKPALWVGTEGGLAKFADGRWTHFTQQNSSLPGNRIRAITETTSAKGGKSLWVGIFGAGLARLANGTWSFLTVQNSGLPHPLVRTLSTSQDSLGNTLLWVGTVGGGLARFLVRDGESAPGTGASDWTVFTTGNSPLPVDAVWSIQPTRSSLGGNEIWVGTLGGGVVRLTERASPSIGYEWSVFNSRNSNLPDNQVIQIAEAVGEQGRALWIGTSGGGVARLEKNQWLTLDPAGTILPDRQIWCFLETRSSAGNPVFWVGTGGGLGRYEAGVWKIFDTGNSQLPNNLVNDMLEVNEPGGEKTIWVATLGGGVVCFQDGGPWKVFNTANSSLKSDNVLVLCQMQLADGSSTIWAGTNGGGLAMYYRGGWEFFDTANSGLSHDSVFSLLETKSANGTQYLWAGTRGGGVARLDVSSFFRQRAARPNLTASEMNGFWTAFTPKNSQLPSNYVLSLAQTSGPDGRSFLWIGTGSGGLCRADLNHLEQPWLVLSDSTTPALPNNTIYFVCQDRLGRIFVYTNKGIACLTVPATAEPGAFYTVQVFGTENGLPSEECNSGAGLVDSQGNLWVGTVGGAAVFNPRLAKRESVVKPLLIERILLNGKDHPVAEGEELSYRDTNFLFEYALLTTFREAAITYQVQLEGFDKTPSEWSADSRKEYTNLGAGPYTFKVWARDYEGNLVGPTTISFQITQAPWRRWWAVGLYILVLGGAIYGFYEWRLHLVNRRQEERIAYLGHLLESTRIINSQLDLTAVLENVAMEGARLVNGAPGGLGVVEGNEVVFRRLWNKNRWEDICVRFQFGEGVAGTVAETGTGLIINDPKKSPLVVFPEMLEKLDVHGFMNIPIVTRDGNVRAVIDVRRPMGRKPFTDNDRKVVEALASQASVAIENASLHGIVAGKNEQLEEKNLMIVESMREIERLYENEQQVNRSLQELNQMKTNFLIVTSHEMRTPLTVIKGYTEALLHQYLGPLTPSQNRAITASQRMVERMATTFEDILTMLKINERRITLKLSHVEVGALVSEAIEELNSFLDRRQQTLVFSPPAPALVQIDQEKLKLVLVNIIQNAIKFTHDQGEIRVEVQETEAHVTIKVTDSGIGIEAHEVERVFDRFYTGSDPLSHHSGKFEFSARGTGLGLSIARSYIEAHGGKVWAESEGLGKGSSFYVQIAKIPVIDPETATTTGEHAIQD